MLALITHGTSGLTSEHSNAPAGDHVRRRVAELVDPMKSSETEGWLRGELQAPT
jgi:hypothetical protein